MSLYLKDKNDESQNIASKQKEAEQSPAKQRSVFMGRSKRLKKILSAVGLLCVLAVIAGAAAYMPILSKAAVGEPDTPEESWETAGLAGYDFNIPSGGIDTLTDFEYLGTVSEGGDFCYVAAIETEDQLKAVLSGLKTSKTIDNVEYSRDQVVVFKLTKDLTLNDWVVEGNANKFQKAVFDGQGHVITCAYSDTFKNNEHSIDAHSGTLLAYGMLFGGVSDATVRNLQVVVKDGKLNFKFSAAGSGRDNLGIGGVCGLADQAVFSDIEINGTWEVVNRQSYCIENRRIGTGGLIGIVQSNVSVTRCKDDSDVNTFFESCRGGGHDAHTIWAMGGIVGQIAGENNILQACWGNGAYTYSGDTYYLEGFVECGTIVGDVQQTGAVTIKDCAGRDDMGMIAAAYTNVVNNNKIIVSNCYGKTPYTLRYYEEYNFSSEYHVSDIAYGMELTSCLSEKKERINDTDWEYDADNTQHYLLHPTSNYWVKLKSIKIGDPVGEEHKITITGSVILFDSSNTQIDFPGDAKVYIYMTTDGTDPRDNAVPTESVAAGENQSEIELSASTKYTDTSQNLNVRVRLKVELNESTQTGAYTWWSSIYEKEFEASDLYIDEPTLQVSIENQSYEDFQETTAYPLGTTKLQLQGNGATEYAMYYDFRDRSGMVLGESDSDNTIYWQTMTQKNKYKDAFTLTEDMVKNTSSNIVYLYVLAHIKKDNADYYKLYEYDIVVFAKDKLVRVAPGSGTKVPNGSNVTFKVGSGIAGEYPYDAMNVLISKEQNQYRTLEGISGVVKYTGKTGSGTEDDPWYLLVQTKLTGDPGQTVYIYVEPCVNQEYIGQYGKFVQEYTYTIMDRASDPVLSPSTITTADSGYPTSIPINEKIYMNSDGSSDIIVYNMTGEEIKPQMVTDETVLGMLNSASVNSVGENAYYRKPDGSVLYVRCNNLWYSMDDADEVLNVYRDGNLFFDSTHAGKEVLLSTLLFSAGYETSKNLIYIYQVNEKDAVTAPKALLAGGSTISMDNVLNFSCGKNCVMYYTTDGSEPVVSVDDDGKLDPDDDTYRYDPDDGIAVTTQNGFSYGTTVTIKIVAYPVEDTSEDPPVYNSDKKCSEVSAFSYTVREQNQVEAPVSYPETSTDNVTVVVNGDRISLSCATPGAEIYYTVNGRTPSIEEEYRYSDAIRIDGGYGEYFSVKAIACKEGMKNSEVVTYLYRIAEKDTVSRVTAIPSTTNHVVAGDKIILSTTESGADIYYTIDGTTPNVTENEDGSYTLGEGVLLYDPAKSITVPEGSGYFTIQAIAVKADMTNSPVAQFAYSYADAVGMPYGNPSPGTVIENTQVTLQCAREDAVIYYEIAYNGAEPATPTTSSAVFSAKAPIIITRDTKIKAFAYYDRESSEVVTLSYTLAQKMDPPESSVSSGAIVPSGTTVKLSTGKGKVYYTTDGSDPTDSANTAINIGSDVVIVGKAGDKVIIKACTKENGATTSEIVTFTYQISQYTGGVKTDTEVGSTLKGGTAIQLVTDVTGGTIYYTTGSGNPITEGTSGNSVTLSGEAGADITVKAVAIAPGTTMTGSYASFTYKLMEQLAAPNASVKDGTRLTESTSVVLKANRGKIYFTIDGTEPTRGSNEYTAPIVVSKNMTIRAIAIEEGSENSEISTFSYTFAEKVKDVNASISSGTVQSGEVVRLSCATEGAQIYYTTDGTDPSDTSGEGVFVYDETEGISIYRSVNIKAVAVTDGLCDSEILSLNYLVDEVPVEIERERAAESEQEAGLKPSDLTNLEDRREQPVGEEASYADVLVEDFISHIKVVGTLSALPDTSTLRGKEISVPESAEAEVKKLLGDDYELICNYDLNLYENGERIQPDGKIEIGIPIPEEYENADVVIVYINENNGVKVCSTRRENGYAYTEVSHLSSYALAGAQIGEKRKQEQNLILTMSIVAGMLVPVGAGMIIMTIRRRKRY